MGFIRRLPGHPAVWIIAAMLTLWGVTCLWVFSHTRVPSTGDALLDRYFADCDERTGRVPIEKLYRWEAQFGRDPRYWELCSVAADRMAGLAIPGAPSYWTRVNSQYDWYMDGASSHQAVSSPLFRSLISERENEWAVKLTQGNSRLARLKTGYSYQDPSAAKTYSEETENHDVLLDRELCQAMDGSHRAERDALYGKMVAALPDSSGSWTRHALLCFWRNDSKGAVDDLRRSNSAPENITGRPYPVGMYLQQLRSGGKLSTHPRAYLLDLLSESFPSADTDNRVEQMLHRLWRDAVAADDRETLNVIHEFTCRAATRMDAPYHAGGRILQQIDYHLQYLEWYRQDLSAGDRQHIRELQAKVAALASLVNTITASTPAANKMQSRPPMGLLGELSARSLEESYMQAAHLDNVSRYRNIETQCVPLFEEISRFDFVTLDWTPQAKP